MQGMEIIKVTAEIDEIQNTKAIEKINQIKRKLFEMTNKIENKERRVITQITNVRNGSVNRACRH